MKRPIVRCGNNLLTALGLPGDLWTSLATTSGEGLEDRGHHGGHDPEKHE
jgi:hypothetical protein